MVEEEGRTWSGLLFISSLLFHTPVTSCGPVTPGWTAEWLWPVHPWDETPLESATWESVTAYDWGPSRPIRRAWEALIGVLFPPLHGSVYEACWIKEQPLMPNGVASLHLTADIQELVFLYEPWSSLSSLLPEEKWSSSEKWAEMLFKDSTRKRKDGGGSAEHIC